MLSIIDIARQLNLSQSTVSFILNGKSKERRISDQSTQKVLKFIKEVGYKPNLLARSAPLLPVLNNNCISIWRK